MSWWQFTESVDGWIAAHTDPSKEGLSEDEADGLWAMVQGG